MLLQAWGSRLTLRAENCNYWIRLPAEALELNGTIGQAVEEESEEGEEGEEASYRMVITYNCMRQ